ncbi:MAG: hypothetical protein IPI67_33555 [Myxococcales bacterium]|nr:hypothetical protein [Myxococcales bacterium]
MNARGRSLVYAIAAVFAAGLIAFAAHAVKTRRSGATGDGSLGMTSARAAGMRIGEPIALDDLSIFPIFSADQQDPGSMTTLPLALAAGVAEVREVGGQAADQAPNSNREGEGQAELPLGPGPTVNTLVIANNGDTPIYVLAGTVVKGGNQDRQIAQDFVVGARATVPVEAFCVEHGRWTGERDGVGTRGKFESEGALANAKVRAAGQYESNQSEVWSEVAKVNAAHGKHAASGTLMATLDDAQLSRERAELGKRIEGALASARPSDELIGMAYAVGGRVKGVRWFASHQLFELFRATLVGTAAVDALTERGGAAPKPAPAMVAGDVGRFMRDIDGAKPEQKATRAGNVNSYKKAKAGYGSSTLYKPSPAATQIPLSRDYVGK